MRQLLCSDAHPGTDADIVAVVDAATGTATPLPSAVTAPPRGLFSRLLGR